MCLALVFYASLHIYKSLNTIEERKFFRTKLLREINIRKRELIQKSKESELQERLKLTGISYLTALKVQVARIILITIVTLYYVVLPLALSNFTVLKLFIPLLLFGLTEPYFKWSLINVVINYFINMKRKQKTTEVFALFDILKSDLSSLGQNQEVNIYSIIKDSIPMFEHISGSLSRVLSLWKHSPEKAKDVLYEEIGGESTKILGEIIYKLDQTSRKEALEIIQSESEVFSTSYYEEELQNNSKKKSLLFSIYSVANLLILGWLIILCFQMVNNGMGSNLL